MKIYLDDERPTPPGWVGVKTAEETVRVLRTGRVTQLSLDHDLGPRAVGTGYDVLVWLEQAVFAGRLRVPKIYIHTANPSARVKMLLAVTSIERLAAR